MADNYKTRNGVTVTAEQFDLTSNPQKIPAACIADGDWSRAHGASEGWRVETDAMSCFPMSGDWIVTKNGHTFVVGDALFSALFVAV